jgi:predicted nucleotidyltransferase
MIAFTIMSPRDSIVQRIRSDAQSADVLHQQSRTLLVRAVRAGASAGLSQREIAAAIGRSQPEVSRLLRFHGTSELGRRIATHRKEILDITQAHDIRNLRVFGSVARGDDHPESDIDLLADIPDTVSLFMLARVENELAELLGARVDIVPSATLRPHLAQRVGEEAIPL